MLTLFKIEFFRGFPGLGPFIYVLAHDGDDAAILAKAQRILSGQADHAIEHIWTIKDEAKLAKVRVQASAGLPHIIDFDALP